jgi:hypothetical protein
MSGSVQPRASAGPSLRCESSASIAQNGSDMLAVREQLTDIVARRARKGCEVRDVEE